MASTKKRHFSMNLRDVENFFKYRRMPYPKRSAEFIALIAVSCTLFLFLHTKTLNSRLHEMEIKLQPSELSAMGLSASNSIQSGSESKSDLKGVHGTYQYLKSTGQISRFTADELNNTKRAEMDIIFFNRVPKVGSQKLMALMKSLGKINGYTAGRDPANTVETIILTHEEQNDLAEEVADIEDPAAYSKHVAFVNFTKFDLPKPIYINLVRDPVERIISWFYYVRAPWYFVERKMLNDKLPLPKPAWLRKDFETCIRNGDKECTFAQNSVKEGVGDHRRQTLFFCGHERALCLPFNSVKAMQIAKRTVEKEYAVVGSWEETNITLAVLEKYIPKFFRKASVVYYQSSESLSKVNRNIFKPPVSEEVKDINSLDESAESLNNTKKARMDIVFFNRVPKTGSQALMQLMKELAHVNKIQTARDKAQKYETVIMGPLNQINVAEEVAEQKEPTFYSKHVAYINFTRYELPKPIYVNLVRDPIERIISWYNYVRAPWYYKQLQSIFKDVKMPDKEWMELDFDTCVRQKNKLCVFEQGILNDGSSDHRRQTLFFCGHNRAECLPFNSREVLQKAKKIVEEEYAVVGTWEEPNITLSVLEHYVPMFFRGITNVYYSKKDKFDKVNKNGLKKPVSDEIREMLRKNLTNEIEFYEYCKQRLYRQYKALNLS